MGLKCFLTEPEGTSRRSGLWPRMVSEWIQILKHIQLKLIQLFMAPKTQAGQVFVLYCTDKSSWTHILGTGTEWHLFVAGVTFIQLLQT